MAEQTQPIIESVYKAEENRKNLLRLIKPSGSELTLYVVLSLTLLIVTNIRSFWHYYTGVTTTGDYIDTSQISNFFDQLSQHRGVQIIFWIIVGLIIYSIIWLAKNVFINIYNDIAADKYVHPKTYDSHRYWQSVVGRKVIGVFLLIFFIAFLIYGSHLLGDRGAQFYTGVTHARHSSGDILIPVLVVSVLVYVFFRLYHITLNTWLSIYRGL